MRAFAVVLLTAALAGCSAPVSGVGAGAAAPTPTTVPTSAAASTAAAGTGINAESLSTALPVQARNLRLVRVGADEVALQFEFANKGDRPVTPDALGIDQYRRVLMLVDLPRSTAYEIRDAEGNDGRISESNGEQVPPGGAVTVTAVFTAPPTEVTALTAFIDGFLPVAVPRATGGIADVGRRPRADRDRHEPAERQARALHRGRARPHHRDEADGDPAARRRALRLRQRRADPGRAGRHRRRRRRDRRRHRHRDHRRAHRRHRQRRGQPGAVRAAGGRGARRVGEGAGTGLPVHVGRLRGEQAGRAPTPSRTAATTRTAAR